ncbi:MAG: hypothetical protein ABJA74_11640 [Lapillicoccus sp.]
MADGARVVVGPWMTGDAARPCLRCLRLARSDRDGEWPAIEARSHGVTGPRDMSLVAMGAGMAVMVAQAGLTDGPLPAGVSVEVRLPWPRVDHRRWERHTDCPHHEQRVTGGVRRPGGSHPRSAGQTSEREAGQAVRAAR